MGVEDNNVEANEPQDGVQETVEVEAGATQDAQPEVEGAEPSVEASESNVEELVDWQAQAQALTDEIAGLKDAAVRAQAEAQNVRRRSEKDVEKAHKFALEKFAKELLPVVDGLEKAIEAEKSASNEPENGSGVLLEGVEMTLAMFLSGIQKFGLEQVDPVGKTFDPELHEAMTMIESPDAEPNTVVAAMQKGYTLNGRLIRPAMVVISK